MDQKLNEIIEPFATKFILESKKFGVLKIQDVYEGYRQGFLDGLVYLASNTLRNLGRCEKKNVYELKLIEGQWWLINKIDGTQEPFAKFLLHYNQLSINETEEIVCSHRHLIDTGTGYYLCASCQNKWESKQ